MELFWNDGHLSDEGLQAIANGQLDELQSLEASEHLSFCDACLGRYLGVLEGTLLLEPERPLKESVLRRIQRKGRAILFSRYATVAAAAALVLAVWGTGVSGQVQKAVSERGLLGTESVSERIEYKENNLAGVLSSAAGGFSSGLNQLFGGLGGEPSAAREQQERREERIERQAETEATPAQSQAAPASNSASVSE
uniref:Zinc-finger domain-containing protein n=1 Tax=termite gut metagenome TaxID=433724 RepID=S0DDB0_9ZZZZ